MDFIKRFVEANTYKWVWFLGTLIGSLLPIFGRLFASMAFEIKSFDIKDALFAGLAMNLSNLTLIGSKSSRTLKVKGFLAMASGAFIFFLSLLIAIFLCAENSEETSLINVLKAIALAFSVGAVFLSYSANNYVFKTYRL